MTYASVAIAYREQRFIKPHLTHIPTWVDDRFALISTKPWFGAVEPDDGTAKLAYNTSPTTVIENYWPTEESQRNTGQALNSDKDWVIVLDPDEFLSDYDWLRLRDFLETTEADAVVCKGQYTYWKNGYVADPPKDYQQLIAVRPHVKFIDKRVVNTGFVEAPVWVHHFSWARTDEEVWNKISHYAHANDFDIEKWYNEVWKPWQPGMKDVHPTSPSTLHDLIPAKLPPELRKLNLWPKQ